MFKVEEDHNMTGLCGVFKGSRWINGKPWAGPNGVGYGLGYPKIVHLLSMIGNFIWAQ